MKRGDLVEYEGSFWVVHTYDARRTRTAQLLKADGTMVEVDHDLDVPIVGNPSESWPFVLVPSKPRWGAALAIYRVTRAGLVALTPWKDWMFSDALQSGGSLFVGPHLKLGTGDILQVRFEKGAVNVPITPSFGTVAARQARRVVKQPKPPVTVYDRLTRDEDFDG